MPFDINSVPPEHRDLVSSVIAPPSIEEVQSSFQQNVLAPSQERLAVAKSKFDQAQESANRAEAAWHSLSSSMNEAAPSEMHVEAGADNLL